MAAAASPSMHAAVKRRAASRVTRTPRSLTAVPRPGTLRPNLSAAARAMHTASGARARPGRVRPRDASPQRVFEATLACRPAERARLLHRGARLGE
eukprot:5342848-Prymnesium_polylepis.1